MSNVIGRLLGNRYEILEKMGTGGMAVVYRARCTLLNRIVAVKVLRDEYTSDADFVRRFRQEAQAVASLSHPNIVSVYDVGAEDGIHYIVMEYVSGQNLKELIREQAPFSPARAADIASQIATALEHAHENNIVHRDIKPHNILITRNGTVKVTDFGIARAVSAATVTRTGTIIGSVHYFSPEQARGEPTGIKSDIYSLGVVLYEMLTGRVPFEGESPIGVALKHIQSEPAPVAAVNPSVPGIMSRIVQKAMAKNPEFRYETAGELNRDLQAFLSLSRTAELDDDAPTQLITDLEESDIFREGQRTRSKKRRKKVRPVGWILLAVLVLGLLGVGGYVLWPALFPAETTVPDLYGLTTDEAYDLLRERGLEMKIEGRRDSDKLEEGRILSQDPGANSTVRQGRVVQVVVSSGPTLSKIPLVVNKPIRDARIELQNAGFEPLADPDDYIYHETIPKDIVIDLEPAAGSLQPQRTQVRLTVSKGPEPKQIIMPDLRGMTKTEALEAIQAANLLPGPVHEEESTDYVSGQVIEQNPAANSPVMEGTEVTLTVSKGPGPAPQTVGVRIHVPRDGQDHVVRVVVSDGRGTNQVYIGTHASGEIVRRDVTFYGKGKILFYIDDQLFDQRPVP